MLSLSYLIFFLLTVKASSFSTYSAFFQILSEWFHFDSSSVQYDIYGFSQTDDVALLICLQVIDAGVPAVY